MLHGNMNVKCGTMQHANMNVKYMSQFHTVSVLTNKYIYSNRILRTAPFISNYSKLRLYSLSQMTTVFFLGGI
jgi:hypothetical protein